MSTFIEFNSMDDLPIRAIQKLNHNFKNINGSETSMTIARVIEDTVTYESLPDKPSIESIELIEDKSFPDLGIFIDPEEQYPQSDRYALDNLEIDALWNLATV